MAPSILKGNSHKDFRGELFYNNSFDFSIIKRIYIIENNSNIVRGWQGHKIEQRWFSAIRGSCEIKLIKIDNWDKPIKDLKKTTFNLNEKTLDYLYIPPGHITSIKSFERGDKLLVLSDYLLNEVKDDYRFNIDYFN